MKNHQIDLHLGESIRVGVHAVTVLCINEDAQEVVFEVEGPDGSVDQTPLHVSVQRREEPALV